MYWEEAIELIKTHQNNGTVYEHVNGTLEVTLIQFFSSKVQAGD